MKNKVCALVSLMFFLLSATASAGDGKEKILGFVAAADCENLENKNTVTCTVSSLDQNVVFIYSTSKNYAVIKICKGNLAEKIIELKRKPYGAYGSALFENEEGYEFYVSHDNQSGSLSKNNEPVLNAYCF